MNMVDIVRITNGIKMFLSGRILPSSEFATTRCGENVMSVWTVQPNSVKVEQRLSTLSVREDEGIVNLLVYCSVSILLSLKAEGWVEYGR